jgi:hypothetical protein|tara:strand:+ start:1221 stop:1445 length:225 start_codon:yes stop_codon:yes gene_type:complete
MKESRKLSKTIDKQQHEFKCPACNANDIEVRAWVKLNSISDIQISELVSEGYLADVDHWCNECHTHIVPDLRIK